MRRAQALLAVCLPLLASACDIVPQRYQLAAKPLMPVPDAASLRLASDPNTVMDSSTKALIKAYADSPNIEKVHIMVQDSQQKCSAFVNSMFAQTAGSGLLLDVLSTTTSALATVFTPVAATHALSAASTIFSGTRTSLTAEYLNSLTISHVAQAIQSTYSLDMSKYISYLDTVNENTIEPYKERTKIQSFHSECALAPAEGSINAALEPTQQSATQPATTSFDISYSVQSSDVAAAASQTAQQINANANARSAGLTASATGDVVTLQMTKSINIVTAVQPPGGGTSVTFDPGPPATLTVATPHPGDQVTLSISPSAAQTADAPAPTGGNAAVVISGAASPMAAVLGQSPATK